MSISSIKQVRPGVGIVTYSSNGRSIFGRRGKELERVIVLGNDRGGHIPLKVSKPEHVQPYYTLIKTATLERRMLSSNANFLPNIQLPKEDENVNKLWGCDDLWEVVDRNNAHLKEGISVWATFNEEGIIEKLSPEKQDDSTLELRATEPYHLSIIMNDHIPSTFYFQLEVFNWILLHMRNNFSN